MTSQSGGRYSRAPIDKLGWYGLLIRHRLLKFILDGTWIVLELQNRRTRWRTAVMSFFSFLGTEDFFTGIIPLMTWILDARLGRLFTILLSIGFYTAGFFKCFFCLPRPPSPPVIPLHKEENDWAFPSLHGTVGLVVPWYLWTYSYLHYDYWPWWARVLMFSAALIWSSGVIISRLYLGVHNFADMAAGAFAGVWILAIFVLMDDYIDYQCVAGQYVVPKALLLANILLYIHPRTNPETSSYGDSVIMTGSTVGVVVSRVMTFNGRGRYSLLQSLASFDELPWQTLLYRSFLRLIIGTSMIVAGRLLVKPLVKELCYRFYGCLDLPAYSSKDYLHQYPSTTKHYTSAYRLPPLPNLEVPADSTDGTYHNENESEASEHSEQQRDDANDVNHSFGNHTNTLKHRPVCGSCRNFAGALKDTTERLSEDGSRDSLDALPYDVDIPSRFITYSLLGWVLGEGAPAVFELIDI